MSATAVNPSRFEAAGRTFALAPLTNRRVREIAAATGIDLRAAVEQDGEVAALLTDAGRTLRWTFDLVTGQHPDLTYEAFSDDLTGDDVERILNAVWGWVADFSATPRSGCSSARGGRRRWRG